MIRQHGNAVYLKYGLKCLGCNYTGATKICEQCEVVFVRTTKNNSAVPTADMESTAGNEPLAKKKSKGLYQKCSIHVLHRTNRLTDPDGRSIKACIDGLTVAGILPDDSAKFITEISQSQEITKGKEETVITIYEIKK